MNQINTREAKCFILSAAYRQALVSIQTPMRIESFPGDKGTGSDSAHRILPPGFAVTGSKADQNKEFQDA
jgi:hypothetical protein